MAIKGFEIIDSLTPEEHRVWHFDLYYEDDYFIGSRKDSSTECFAMIAYVHKTLGYQPDVELYKDEERGVVMKIIVPIPSPAAVKGMIYNEYNNRWSWL